LKHVVSVIFQLFNPFKTHVTLHTEINSGCRGAIYIPGN